MDKKALLARSSAPVEAAKTAATQKGKRKVEQCRTTKVSTVLRGKNASFCWRHFRKYGRRVRLSTVFFAHRYPWWYGKVAQRREQRTGKADENARQAEMLHVPSTGEKFGKLVAYPPSYHNSDKVTEEILILDAYPNTCEMPGW